MKTQDLVREIGQHVDWVTAIAPRMNGEQTYVFDATDIELNLPVLLKVDRNLEIWVNFDEQWMPCGCLEH